MNIELYIQSGIVESYVLGLATIAERVEFEQLMPHYPELKTALSDFEYQLELFAIDNEIPPPPGVREQVEAKMRETPVVRREQRNGHANGSRYSNGTTYLNVEASSDYIRVHKSMRTLFIVLFVLTKICLALAVFYYVEYRHARQEVRQVRELQAPNSGGQ